MSILSTSKVSTYKMQEHPPQSAFTKKKKRSREYIDPFKKKFFFKVQNINLQLNNDWAKSLSFLQHGARSLRPKCQRIQETEIIDYSAPSLLVLQRQHQPGEHWITEWAVLGTHQDEL